MEIKRNIYYKIVEWKKETNGTKALLIEGARQMHNKAMHLFMEYMLVGGMPQAIVAFKKNGRDFHAADVEKRDILALYEDDIKKAARKYKSKVSAIFDNIPGFLSTHEKGLF